MYFLYIDPVIRNQNLSVADKLHGDFRLSHSAFSGNHDSLAVHDHKIAGQGFFRCQPLIQEGDQIDHHAVGIRPAPEDREVAFHCDRLENRRNLIVFGDDDHRGKSVRDGAEPFPLLLFIKMADIFNFLVSDDYYTPRFGRFEIPGQFKTRTVHVRNHNPPVQRIRVSGKLLKSEEINDLRDHYFLFIVIAHSAVPLVPIIA